MKFFAMYEAFLIIAMHKTFRIIVMYKTFLIMTYCFNRCQGNVNRGGNLQMRQVSKGQDCTTACFAGTCKLKGRSTPELDQDARKDVFFFN